MSTLRVGILFGGKSAEHEVSLRSARNVIAALDTSKYEPVLIGIDKSGRWQLQEAAQFLLSGEQTKPSLPASATSLALVPGGREEQLTTLEARQPLPKLDVVFPVLHGPLGEDGTVQGLLKLAGVPFVGPGVLASAVAMDKDVAKRLLEQAGIAVAPWQTFQKHERATIDYQAITSKLGSPVFVKPANLGSSVGVSRVSTQEEFKQALDEAFRFDRKVLVEQQVLGREIECAVLGNEHPEASLPGEIISREGEFYSYENKYIDENGATLIAPAELSEEATQHVQKTAIRVFQVLGCEGMARVDFFLTADGVAVVNEVNTIPGFTSISMYPRLWQVSGLSYPELIDRLLTLALERAEQEQELHTSYE